MFQIPKVSVLVAAYNVDKYIDKCLNSLLNQSYENIEIIVVNDGSTDKTSNKLDQYTDKVKVITQNNSGLSDARNTALDYASGDIISFMDGDDWVDSEWCKDCVYALSNKNVDMVFFGYNSVRENDQVISNGIQKNI